MSQARASSAEHAPGALRIGFVDDEPECLAGLRRRLRAYRGRWEMHFFGEPTRALEHVCSAGLDVIVADLCMPTLSGEALLDRVRNRAPSTTRILMTARAPDASVVQAAQIAHRVLFKPFDGPEIEAVIEHVSALRGLGISRHLERAIGAIAKGPLFPADAAELIDPLRSLLDSSDPTPAKLLAARVYEQLLLPTGCDPDPHWARATLAAEWAGHICESQEVPALVRAHAVLACLLHPLEQLLVARYASDLDPEHVSRHDDDSRAGAPGVCPLAAYVLGLWGFPDPVTEAVAFHRVPSQAPTDALSALSITHVACGLAARELRRDSHGRPSGALYTDRASATGDLDRAYLERLGWSQRVDAWATGCAAEHGPPHGRTRD